MMHTTKTVLIAALGLALAADVSGADAGRVAQWEGGEREKVLEWFRSEWFGRAPVGRPADQKIGERSLTCGNGQIKINFHLSLPEGADKDNPVPVFVFGDHFYHETSKTKTDVFPGIPTNSITGRGYAYVCVNLNDAALNVYDHRWSNRVHRVFGGGKPDSWGTLGAWAWCFSRTVDWIETRPELDAKRVAILGFSRGGKAALWAGAQDERIALTIPHNSGTGGARLLRYEDLHWDLEHIRELKKYRVGFWFCPNFMKYDGREASMPHDADDLMRLVAPRLLYVGSSSRDFSAGPRGEFGAAKLASELWEAYGYKGISVRDFPPENSSLHDGRVAYHLKEGRHSLVPWDWDRYLDYADRFLKDGERMDPVLPGGGRYFWNVKSVWYIYPPAFDFKPVGDAVRYRFHVVDENQVLEFDAEKPTASLAPVWSKVKENGFVTVTCHGVDGRGRMCGYAGKSRVFWKMPAFKEGSYPKAKRPYGEAAKKVYDYVFGLDFVKTLAKTGKPDVAYKYNCYPSKMNSALVRAALLLAERDPSRREFAMKLARAAADYLIETSEPAGAPLEWFSQTYARGNTNYTAGVYAGQQMLVYPAGAARAYLKLFKATGETKYREAAERTAGTYLRLQGKDGTWSLKLWSKDGKPVNSNRLFPLSVCELFEELYELTGKTVYRAAADRGLAYIERGPMVNWNWEGQFEDVRPSDRYQNLTKHPPTSLAMYLLRRYPGDAGRLEQARSLLRFSEDQFVVWERPSRKDGFHHTFPGDCFDPAGWTVFPTVMEQYDWYVPTDSSVCKLIRTYLAFYKAQKNPLDLAKARALGDALTNAQLDSGRIPTQWMKGDYQTSAQSDWINCMLASACALEMLDAIRE